MPLAPTASLQGERESQQQPAPRLPWGQHAAGRRRAVTAHDQTLEHGAGAFKHQERSPSVQGKIFLPSHFP